MIKLIKVRKIIQSIFFILLVFNTGFLLAEEDTRTPFQKYQGAYLGAYLTCVLQQKQIFLLEKARSKGATLDPTFGKDIDLETCKTKGLLEMKKEYKNILPLITTEESKVALKEHYVHAIMHIEEIAPRQKEDEDSYTERMNQTFRNSKELFVRFEITLP
jgi:hypothetical protein